ncbi:MAG: YbjN domain-containing protein [Planctomycetes bacterium]|nr:YbjN domain-containing protein [Planctomycetota bacterium]MCW8138751.1 YbjN domain-containing protein [Planctomycetota bacterium]
MSASLLAAAPLLSAAAQDARGDQRVVGTLTGEEVKAILAVEGYAGITVDEDDDLLFSMEGTRCLVITSQRKTSILARFAWSGTSATLEGVNRWNREKGFSRAYIDGDGDPVLELDLELSGGVTVARVKDFFRTVRVSLTTFKAEVL